MQPGWGEERRKYLAYRQLCTSVSYVAILPSVSYLLLKLTYTSLYKISASITEKHVSALYQLIIAVQEVVIYFKITHTHTHTRTQSW